MNLILHNTHILVAVHTRVMIVWAIHLCLVLPLFGQDKSTQPVDEDRPNILWLSTEDIGPQLGCYGDPVAKTPNLDALAGRGMLFDVAWSNYPVCAPARTTIITGMYAAANGAGHMRVLACSNRQVSICTIPEFIRKDYNHKTGLVVSYIPEVAC